MDETYWSSDVSKWCKLNFENNSAVEICTSCMISHQKFCKSFAAISRPWFDLETRFVFESNSFEGVGEKDYGSTKNVL